MILDGATCQANHNRFIDRIIQGETVWYLENADGVATAESNDDQKLGILLFWSDRAYATRSKDHEFPDHEEMSMDLFDFLFRWLPGMSGDGLLAGTNWTGELIGLEHDPYELREEIEDRLPDEMRERHERQYAAATE